MIFPVGYSTRCLHAYHDLIFELSITSCLESIYYVNMHNYYHIYSIYIQLYRFIVMQCSSSNIKLQNLRYWVLTVMHIVTFQSDAIIIKRTFPLGVWDNPGIFVRQCVSLSLLNHWRLVALRCLVLTSG